jgi:hypothetical protein
LKGEKTMKNNEAKTEQENGRRNFLKSAVLSAATLGALPMLGRSVATASAMARREIHRQEIHQGKFA